MRTQITQRVHANYLIGHQVSFSFWHDFDRWTCFKFSRGMRIPLASRMVVSCPVHRYAFPICSGGPQYHPGASAIPSALLRSGFVPELSRVVFEPSMFGGWACDHVPQEIGGRSRRTVQAPRPHWTVRRKRGQSEAFSVPVSALGDRHSVSSQLKYDNVFRKTAPRGRPCHTEGSAVER